MIDWFCVLCRCYKMCHFEFYTLDAVYERDNAYTIAILAYQTGHLPKCQKKKKKKKRHRIKDIFV